MFSAGKPLPVPITGTHIDKKNGEKSTLATIGDIKVGDMQ